MGEEMTEEIWRPPIANQIKRFKHWPDYPLKPAHVYKPIRRGDNATAISIDIYYYMKPRRHVALTSIRLAWGKA
jgi:hypothetical protein